MEARLGLTCAALFLLVPLKARADDACGFFQRAGARVSRATGQDCQLDGQKVDPNAGGKSGREVCKDSGGKVVSELGWKNGQREGHGFWFDDNGNKLVFDLKKDLAVGHAQVFNKDGKLICDTLFGADGKSQGLAREYTPEGKVLALYLNKGGERQKPRIVFWPDGKLRELKCGDKPLGEEDQALCGFSGQRSQVTLYSHDGKPLPTVLTLRNGKLEQYRSVDPEQRQLVRTFVPPGSEDDYDQVTYWEPGKPFQSFGIRAHKRSGPFKEYTKDGKLLEDDVYEAGQPRSQKSFYLNGNLKEVAVTDAAKKQRSVKHYWDSGKLQSEATYTAVRSGYGSGWVEQTPVGTRRTYFENGQLEEEEHYQDGEREGTYQRFYPNGSKHEVGTYHHGKLAHLERWKENGEQELNEDYFEDGSRKQK